MLSIAQCEKARLSKDSRFDGLFYTAVLTTGIFCRPICPARPPKPENVRYFRHAESALAEGYTPCKRCYPELAPRHAQSNSLVDALSHLNVVDYSITELAEQLNLSERQLRRQFKQSMGLTPKQYQSNQRLMFAVQLLRHTNLSIQDIAFAAGFNSIRRFNEVFKTQFGAPPSAIKTRQSVALLPHAEINLHYRPPYDWTTMLSFFRSRAIPGVEQITASSYSRTIRIEDAYGWLKVEKLPNKNALKLSVKLSNYQYLSQVIVNVRRMFDLDADIKQIADDLSSSKEVCNLVEAFQGVRLPGCWDPFEFSIRAILGQQISVAAATTLAGRIANQYGELAQVESSALDRYFPNVAQLSSVDFESIGLTRTRTNTLKNWIAHCELNPKLLSYGQSLDTFCQQAISVKGIGMWTAQYIAMRGLSNPDAFPHTDLGVLKALNKTNKSDDLKSILAMAELWRPWRSYATIYLWLSLKE